MSARLEITALCASDPRQDAELSAFFESCPTSFAQQTPGWRNVIAEVGAGDESVYLGCRSGGELVGVLPAWRFAGPLGALLASCVQAGPLGGVACRPGADRDAVYRALLTAFSELAVQRGCAVATVISNPLWPDRELCERHLQPDYVLENSCQMLALEGALDGEGRLLVASDNLRRNLRRAESAPLTIDEAQTAGNVEEWYALHCQRHNEIGAAPLPAKLFSGALEHMVPRGKARFFFVRLAPGGEMVAGGFYVFHGAVMDAFMPAQSSAHAKLGANYLLAAHTIGWAFRRGLRFYNWQASPPDGGVYRFKRQWGSEDAPYCYLTRITGDVESLRSAEPDTLRAGYPWHYVLPFDCVGAAAGRRHSTRRSAWHAAGGT
jgi:hypothetical protein